VKRSIVAQVDEPRCIGCARCLDACPVDAIVGAEGVVHTVVASWCIGCRLCVAPCPVDCIALVPAQAMSAGEKRAAGERARQRKKRVSLSQVKSFETAERKAILAALLGGK